ncbi:MAG TPA: universal stress protein [Candidatus Omnitrophota bacterium]|nr:universal stress protein [Candidatus Omnitrophota bacterium]
MSFKDILVHVDNSPHARQRIELAGRLAKGQDAHLIALNVRTRPALPQFIRSQYGAQIDKVRESFNAEAAREARAAFDAVHPEHGITTEWRDVEADRLADTVALHARYCDITVIGQNEIGEDGERPLADALVLDVGRPVLVVPSAGTFPTIGERVLVAWNGSREATRAVHDALPLLKSAKLAHVIAVNPSGGMAGHGDVPGADICLHLTRHGVNAVCEHVRSEDLNVGQMLLSRAADEDADLIVMGAYGRSRLRELVLGGATRHLLRHMTVPVLMSH